MWRNVMQNMRRRVVSSRPLRCLDARLRRSQRSNHRELFTKSLGNSLADGLLGAGGLVKRSVFIGYLCDADDDGT